jgi:lysophospholipase L1-like esterase
MTARQVIPLMTLAAASLAPLQAADQSASFFLRDGDRMVFYGDSITDQEWYPTLVQTFVMTRFPKWRNEFTNRGQSGDNAGSLKRFERDVAFNKPTALTFMMGYNDPGYTPFQPEVLSKFVDNVTKSVQLARAANPAMRVLLIGPTPNETVVSSSYPRWVTGDFYPYTLLMYGREEGRLAQRLGVQYVDMTTLYGQTMGFGRVLAQRAFALSRDGVHPQQEGQTFIAYHLLRAMGGSAQLATVAIDAAHGKLLQAERCAVTNLRVAGGTVSFTRKCDSLPYPTPAVARPFSLLVDLDNTLNADTLTVTGLTAPSYALSVDGEKIAELPASELADGVNLSAYPTTPMYQQSLAVLDAVRQKDLLDCAFWREYIMTGKADGAGNPLGTDPAVRAEIESARQAIAAARLAAYALNTPHAHKITLEPLDTVIPRYADLAATDLNQAFLICSVTKLGVDWNAMKLLDNQVEIHLQNPGATSHHGTITWNCPTGWEITPAQADFTVEGGQTAKIPFTVTCPAGPATIPPPTATVRWHWTPDWAYPMQRDVEMELAPRLTIPRLRTPVSFTSRLSDWQDAVSFPLDKVYFIDPTVPGKRNLWDGPADLSARIMMKWDDQALYFCALVRDDHHVQNQPFSMMWSQDMVQMAAFTQEKGKPDGRYEWGYGVYEGDRSEAGTYTSQPPVAAGAPPLRFQGHVDEAAGTCLYEIAVPWARLAPLTPAAGKSLRFTVTIGDAKPQPGKGYNFLAWTNGIAYGKDPADFATVVLGE